MRRRYGIFPPLELRFDEYDVDITENRLSKAAVQRLSRLAFRSASVRRSLRSLRLGLDSVSLMEYPPRQVPEVRYHRLNEHYRPAVELARWILRNTSHDVGRGGWTASAFLVDMNRVFESFVVVALREDLGLSDRTFAQNCRGRPLWLDQARRIRLEPDLSWWDGDRCVFVGDVEYKELEGAGDFRHPDVYQMLAYLTATGLPAGLLVYAAGEERPAVHTIRGVGVQVRVVTLDLAGTREELLRLVAGPAGVIRRLRRLGMGRAA